MCCDTTSSNTGCHIGACTLLEKNFNKNLLHAMYMHQVAELALASAYDVCFPQKWTVPEIVTLKKFKADWKYIDQENYQTALVDDNKCLKSIIRAKRAETLNFIKEIQQLEKQPRKDYA